MKIGKSASETLALITVAYGEHAMMKSSVFNGTVGSRKGEKTCKTTQEVGKHTRKGQMQMSAEYEPWYAQIER
jgi:hypothetical protein